MDVLENSAFEVPAQDLPFLRRRLGNYLEARHDGWAVTRHAGQLSLPSGEVLRIHSPKAPAASLLSWLAYADPTLRGIKAVERRIPHASGERELAALVARLFMEELRRAALQHGMIRSYRAVRVVSASVRGKIDFARLTRSGGNLARLPCTAWERLPQTPLNAFLAAACRTVARNSAMRAACGRSLAQARSLLEGVRPAVDAGLLSGRTVLSRQEHPFEAACALGRLILRQTWFGSGTDRGGASFLVNLDQLFERTIETAFREAGVLARRQAPLQFERMSERGPLPRGSMLVDLLVPSGPLIVDSKFKTSVSSGNLQQVVTYCYLHGASRAVLVLPAGHLGPDQPRSYRLCGAGLTTTSGRSAEVVVQCVELETTATDLGGWRANGRRLVEATLVLRSVSKSP